MQGNSLKTALLSVAVSAATTVIVTQIMARQFPLVQQMRIVDAAEVTESLRDGYPAFAYNFRSLGTKSLLTKPYLFGSSDVTMWDYQLRLVNLSKVDVPSTDVVMKIPQRVEVYVRPLVPLHMPDGGTLKPGAWSRLAGRKDEQVRFTLAGPQSSRAFTLDLSFRQDERPGYDLASFDIRCGEGAYMELTPSKWDAIGWKAQ